MGFSRFICNEGEREIVGNWDRLIDGQDFNGWHRVILAIRRRFCARDRSRRGIIANNNCGLRRQKRPDFRQQFLKPFVGAAGARVVAAELFEELFVAVNDARAAFYVGFGGVASAAFAGGFKSRSGRNIARCDRRAGFAWDTSFRERRKVPS
jgi:hypothetical protein